MEYCNLRGTFHGKYLSYIISLQKLQFRLHLHLIVAQTLRCCMFAFSWVGTPERFARNGSPSFDEQHDWIQLAGMFSQILHTCWVIMGMLPPQGLEQFRWSNGILHTSKWFVISCPCHFQRSEDVAPFQEHPRLQKQLKGVFISPITAHSHDCKMKHQLGVFLKKGSSQRAFSIDSCARNVIRLYGKPNEP